MTLLNSRSEEHISFLDTIRGIAIAMVFAFHALGPSFGIDHLSWDGWFRDFSVPRSFLALLPATLGWSGVAVFFVVSGFCIHLSHERSRRKDFKVFFIRRFFRIYPPYLLALSLFAFVVPWTRLKAGLLENAAQFGTHALLVHNFDARYFFGINPAFWSIAVEVQLYLLYPVLLWLTRRAGWKGALWATGALELSLRLLSGGVETYRGEPLTRWVTGNPLAYWFSWTLGAMLAENYLKGQPIFMSRMRAWIWAPLIVAAYLIRPAYDLCFLLVALCTTNVMAVLLARPRAGSSAGWLGRHFRFAGKLSYSIYLIHQPLLWIVRVSVIRLLVGHPISSLATYACCMAAWGLLMLPSWVFYRFVELPSIDLGKWYVRRSTSPLPQPADPRALP